MTGITVLTGGKIFDGTDFLEEPTDIVLEGDRIAAIGPGLADDPRYTGAETVDCSGRTVLPGLVDLHVHVMAENPGSVHEFVEPFSLQFYRSARNLARTLEAGITTVRDAGGADLGTKQAVDQGIVRGPRMHIAVSIMSQTGGHGDFWQPSGAHAPGIGGTHPGRPSGVADGVEEVRKKTREILRAGADQIKICSTGGVLSPSDDPRHSQFTEDEIRVIVEEAAAQGTYVMAHAQGSEGIKNALRAGVRTIEHGIYLDEEAIELFQERGAVLVPTLAAPLAVLAKADTGVSGLPPAVVAKARAVVERHRESVARAIEAGVTVGMGTDSGVGPHGENLQELSLLADLGMDLTGALRSATSIAGALVDPSGRTGRLSEGAHADVLVLDGELGSIAQLATLPASIRQVWKAGVLEAGEKEATDA
ncbi:metal-dependent hydrolase family protein [Sediminivirga luteola]|uniref:Hydrolase n=1 Tax=Sediminivirga luteola TaxID=1774748 RepID=A0A8J2TYQ6_9MICO|nr:amidohydrolase family protein [Sediminivirga luteola]GGA16337.1 hydrolase [Sediminivirga luteola]